MKPKKLSLEEMGEIEGGWGAGSACGALMGGWGLVLTYGVAAASVTAGTSVAIAGVWLGLTVGLCGAVSYATH
jgi:hypothetical protein